MNKCYLGAKLIFIMCSTPGSVPNRGAGTFIDFDDFFLDFPLHNLSWVING